MDTSLAHDTAKGVACETGEFRLQGIPGCMIGIKDKRTCLLAFLDVRNTISSCLHFCCMKNRIILFSHVQIN